jgi:hypothetical protein
MVENRKTTLPNGLARGAGGNPAVISDSSKLWSGCNSFAIPAYHKSTVEATDCPAPRPSRIGSLGSSVMRLSGLELAIMLLFSSLAVAQHAGSGGGSSGGSGGSHASSGGTVSGGSGSHSVSSHSGASHSSHAAPSVREPGISRTPMQPAKRTVLSFLRHPFRKPPPKALRQRVCAKGPCPVCPGGQASGKNGGCVASAQTHVCRASESWSGGGCVGNVTPNCSLDGNGELRATENSTNALKNSMDAACSADPGGQQCSEQSTLYQRAVGLYRQQQEAHSRAFQECEGRGSSSLPVRRPSRSPLP